MSFITYPLAKKHKKDSFECEQPSLTRYLKEQASQDMKKKLALCFVYADHEKNVEGYYTLSNDSIPKSQVPEAIQKKLGYPHIPVTLLGRLARHQKLRGQGLGELLLLDALKKSLEASLGHSASFAVVTDPIDGHAENFYRKFGFVKLEGSQRMFLPMKTVEVLFHDQK